MYHLIKEGTGETAVKVVSDIIDIAKGARSASGGNSKNDSSGRALKTYSYSSIASAAAKLIAVFPLLVSKTVSSDTAQMVSKYIEQKGCVLLQIALQQANISSAQNGIEYFKNFHQNIDFGGGTLNTLSDAVDAWAKTMGMQGKTNNSYTGTAESVSMLLAKENAFDFPYDETLLKESDDITLSPIQMKELLEVMKENENAVFYDTKLNPISINDYVVKESAGEYHVTLMRNPLNEDAVANWVKEADVASNKDKWNEYNNLRRMERDRREDEKYERDKVKQRREDEKYRREDEKYEREKEKQRREDEKYERELAKERELVGKNARSTVPAFLKDQDIKKMNNAVPSILVVRFYNNTNATVATEFIIGVKSMVIGCSSSEVLRRIANDNKDGRFFLNLMRTITGELKKTDFLFGLSRIDEDLRNSRKKGALGDTWKLLQNRAMAAKQAVKSGSVNNYAAITTVVVSQEDCDELYKEENINMADPSTARHFMKSYNLLAFVICDDSTESIKVLFDDDNKYFEELSYKMLERETQDGTYKKLINLISSSR